MMYRRAQNSYPDVTRPTTERDGPFWPQDAAAEDPPSRKARPKQVSAYGATLLPDYSAAPGLLSKRGRVPAAQRTFAAPMIVPVA